MNKPPKEVTRISLVSLPNEPVPMPIRLKRLLKCLLRSYGFRCVWIDGGAKPAGTEK